MNPSEASTAPRPAPGGRFLNFSATYLSTFVSLAVTVVAVSDASVGSKWLIRPYILIPLGVLFVIGFILDKKAHEKGENLQGQLDASKEQVRKLTEPKLLLEDAQRRLSEAEKNSDAARKELFELDASGPGGWQLRDSIEARANRASHTATQVSDEVNTLHRRIHDNAKASS